MRSLAALAAFALLMLAPGVRAEDAAPDPRAPVMVIADNYMAAYQELDLGRIAPLLSDDARFVDPTSFDMPGFAAPFDFQGRDAILAGIEGFKTNYGLVRVPYAVSHRIAGMHDVAYIGEVQSEVNTAQGVIRYAYPIITIIKVRDGLVVEHRDYVDYPAGRQISP